MTISEDVVISGIAGRFPDADSMAELKEHLMNGVDMVTANRRRWPDGLFGLPARMGLLKDISRLDATFFGIHPKQVDAMDPQGRMLLEATYEAIVDAGVNPEYLRGRNVGVFVGASVSETEEALNEDDGKNSSYVLLGGSRALLSNRISYVFDFKGPGFTLDSACSSSLLALSEAKLAIDNGLIEAAIVGGVNLSLNPKYAANFLKLGVLSADGKCRVFDAEASGYARSEAVGVIFMQKASDAKRNYATVVCTKSNNDGFKEEGITFPNGASQNRLLEDVYGEAAINPNDIAYIEAHGTGTKVGDPQEANNIADFFCKDRKNPLLIGSVKTNTGHAEPACGICSVAKLVITMESGIIPANLHYNIPNPKIPALTDGRLKVVTENTPFEGGLLAVCNYGFGGTNVHAVLRPNPVNKNCTVPVFIDGPKLFNFSGRTEKAVDKVLTYMEEHSEDHNLYALLSEPALTTPGKHPYRGYAILNSNPPVKKIWSSSKKRPIWYVYSGMGSQWTGMGKDLMKIEIFHDTVMRIHNILKPFDIDVYNMMIGNDETTCDDILSSFITIACFQIAITNILKAIGIEPDGMIGHSFGELGCSYADGCLTEEQVIMSVYYRGFIAKQANLPAGAMAVAGLSWEEATELCPEGVVPACHNAEENVTLSGPAQLVEDFIDQLTAKGNFAKKVNTHGMAFHSHQVSPMVSKYRQSLKQVIPNPKQRTSRWISTSVPESQWDTPLAQMCSAEYHTNNLISPVLFHSALGHVPKEALLIEIAPHGLMQSILKRTLGPESTVFDLLKRNQSDGLSYLLNSLGKIYLNGVNLDVSKMYPNVQFPVPRGTPMISPLIEWDHSQSWMVPTFDMYFHKSGANTTVEVDISTVESEDYYLLDHTVDGRVVYPATGYLVLAWKALARIKGKEYRTMPVVFEDVVLHRATILSRTEKVKIDLSMMAVGGQFEITEGDNIVATGKIYEPEKQTLRYADDVNNGPSKSSNEYLQITSKDIYKALRILGYEYGPTFQAILESDNEGSRGKLKWDENWVIHLDSILQFYILGSNSRNLRLPTGIKEVRINPELHKTFLISVEADVHVPIMMDSVINVCISGGVEMKAMKSKTVSRRPLNQSAPILEEHHFVPHMEMGCLSSSTRTEQDVKHYADLCTDYIIHQTKKLVSQGISLLPNPELFVDISKKTCNLEITDQVVEEYLTHNNLNSGLLKVLQNIFKTKLDDDFKVNVEKLLGESKSLLQEDGLLAALLDDRILRTSLDIVLENVAMRKIKIVEANAAIGNLFPKIVVLLRMQPRNQVDCIVTDINPINPLSTSDLEMHNLKSAKWDFTKDVAPGIANEADMIFGNGIITANIKNLRNRIRNLANSLKDGGFLLFLERIEECVAVEFLNGFQDVQPLKMHRDILLEIFRAEGLELVSEKADGILSSLFLLRKVRNGDMLDITVVMVEEGRYENWVHKLKEQLEKIAKSDVDKRLWLVAHDTVTNGIIGMINCLCQEVGGNNIRCIFNPTLETSKVELFVTDPIKSLKSIYGDIIKKDLVINIYRDGAWGTYRHIPLKYDKECAIVESSNSYINVLTRGDLSSLRWIESSLKHHDSKDDRFCQVYYSALNFKDTMQVSGKLDIDSLPSTQTTQDCLIGVEYSGRDVNGRRIMGALTQKALATSVLTDSIWTWPVPDNWTLEEAATVPIVYSTVYYSLCLRGNLKDGETVLIHSGAGGVGQAAIAVALSRGCRVFTTVSSQEKRDYLKNLFPQLKDENFANSRDTSFENYFRRATGGRGVDVILNSLSEEKLMASIRLLAGNGRFLEIGKFDFSKNTPLGMEIFLKNISFHGILLETVMNVQCAERKIIADMMQEGIESGVVKPLCRTVFEKDQAEAAFRFMASGKHIGKVLVKIRDEEPEKVTVPVPLKVKSIARTTFHPKKSYVVSGGLGGFGLEFCSWLVERGARHLVLSSRTGIRDGYQSYCVRRWREYGVEVLVSQNDIVTQDGATKLLVEAAKLGPVAGIFNLAMVLKDGFMERQTAENFFTVCAPKVDGTRHLDRASRKLLLALDYFVVFSSVSSGYGNLGQANYGFANSAMERIVELRSRDGLPGMAIQWGAIGDVGVFVEKLGGSHDVAIAGTLPQRIVSCMTTMDVLLNQSHPVVTSYVLSTTHGPSVTRSVKAHNLVDVVANILGIKEITALKPDITLGELGMDSLMSVEIKHALEREFNTMLPMKEIRQLSIKMLDAINIKSHG